MSVTRCLSLANSLRCCAHMRVVELNETHARLLPFHRPYQSFFPRRKMLGKSFLAWAMTWWTWTNLIMFRYAIFFRPSSSATCCTNTFATLLKECFGGNLREKFRKFFWNRFSALTFPLEFEKRCKWVWACLMARLVCRQVNAMQTEQTQRVLLFICMRLYCGWKTRITFSFNLRISAFPGVFHQQSMRDGESKSGDSEAYLGVWHPSASAMGCLDFE